MAAASDDDDLPAPASKKPRVRFGEVETRPDNKLYNQVPCEFQDSEDGTTLMGHVMVNKAFSNKAWAY